MALYAIGIGSNRRRGSGSPTRVVAAAAGALAGRDIIVRARAPIVQTAPIGLAGRRFANSAVIIETMLTPPALLARLKGLERAFGRRRGRRWSARVLDLDVLLWSEGRWQSRKITIPHPALATRRFVLDPLVAMTPEWRIPRGYTVTQARARLTRAIPVHRSGPRSGP